jgi:hypothetical protein
MLFESSLEASRKRSQPTQRAKALTLVFTLRLKDGGSQLRLGSVSVSLVV